VKTSSPAYSMEIPATEITRHHINMPTEENQHEKGNTVLKLRNYS
jgi:hypothetical protein